MSPTARTQERARIVDQLFRTGLTLDVIAHRLGVTPRTATRLNVTARTLPEEPATPNTKGWGQQALCRKVNPTWFFPPAYDNARPEIKAAKYVCHSCPVLDDCRTFALDNPELTADGIWCGLTPRERNRARKVALTERTTA